jgi:hypothetical protein
MRGLLAVVCAGPAVAAPTSRDARTTAPAHARVAQPRDTAVVAEVLAAAAESLFVAAARPRPGSGMLLAADPATARALDAPARRAGLAVRVVSGGAYCAEGTTRERGARTVGTVASLALDSLTADRAVVRWAVTCLLESRHQPAPFPGGSTGAWEIVRRGRAWRVARALSTLEM